MQGGYPCIPIFLYGKEILPCIRGLADCSHSEKRGYSSSPGGSTTHRQLSQEVIQGQRRLES